MEIMEILEAYDLTETVWSAATLTGHDPKTVKRSYVVGGSDGAALRTEIGAHGPGGRAHYEPRAEDPRRWDWSGDTP